MLNNNNHTYSNSYKEGDNTYYCFLAVIIMGGFNELFHIVMFKIV